MAGQMMNARDMEKAVSELARPRTRSSLSRLTSGFIVGDITVSPSPKSAVKPNTKAIRAVAGTGRPARPNTAHETAKISPVTASALLRRARRTRRSTNSWASTMRAVLTVSDKATTRADTCPSTVA
jgi:ribosomal protein L44E